MVGGQAHRRQCKSLHSATGLKEVHGIRVCPQEEPPICIYDLENTITIFVEIEVTVFLLYPNSVKQNKTKLFHNHPDHSRAPWVHMAQKLHHSGFKWRIHIPHQPVSVLQIRSQGLQPCRMQPLCLPIELGT